MNSVQEFSRSEGSPAVYVLDLLREAILGFDTLSFRQLPFNASRHTSNELNEFN